MPGLSLLLALDRIGQEWRPVPGLHQVWRGVLIELGLGHQIGLLGIERTCCASPPVHHEGVLVGERLLTIWLALLVASLLLGAAGFGDGRAVL